MSLGLIRLIDAAQEPVDVAEAMTFLRQDDPTDEPLVKSLLKTARLWIENTYDLTMVEATWQGTMDRFPRYSSSAVWQFNSDAIWQQRLPVTQLSGQWYPDRASIRALRPPLVSVVSITYFDGQGILQTVPTTVYNVDTSTPRGRIAPAFGQIWPIVRQQLATAIVTYVAGYGPLGTDVPETLRTAVKMLTLHLYEHRGDEDVKIPETVHNLIRAEFDAEYN